MKRMLTALVVATLLVVLATGLVSAAAGAIKNTKHDLSLSGPASAKTGESEICVFCHTPHNARINVPLWNRQALATPITYSTYANPDTIQGTLDTITSSSSNVSVLCLSCHDGTLSVGAVVNNYGSAKNTTIAPAVGVTAIDGTTGKLISGANLGGATGTDLTNDHPIAITYNTVPGDLKATPTKAQLYNNKVECASCHAVHGGTGFAPFLRMDNAGSALCLDCHIK